jgi:hypothetical protein
VRQFFRDELAASFPSDADVGEIPVVFDDQYPHGASIGEPGSMPAAHLTFP